MNNRFEQHIIMVTGATTGLGRALCLALAREGANVIALARSEDGLADIQGHIEKAGGRCLCVPFDLSSFDAYDELLGGLSHHIPHLNGLVHAAGQLDRCAPMEHVKPEAFRQMLDIHLAAPNLLTRALFPLLERAKATSVIFTACDMSQKTQPNWHGYGIAKGALCHSVELWQMEHPKKAIRFNALNPGRMRTTSFMRAYPGLDPGTVPPPAETCEAFLYLLSDDAKDIRGQLLDAKDVLNKSP